MPFLYSKINQINKKLPMNVYIPFLHNSCRNYVVVHIPLEEIKIFRTKTRAPIMLCFEIVRMDEINSNLNKNSCNLRIRSKSISSKNSSLISNNNNNNKKLFKDLNSEIDENLSKPLKLNENKNDIKINNNLQEIKENENNRFLNIVNRFIDINNEEKHHRRLSVRNALNSTQIIRNNFKESFMEEITEKDEENEKNSTEKNPNSTEKNNLNKSFNNEIIINTQPSKSESTKVEIINEKKM
jgi:phosphatidylinositol 4-kinase